MPSSAKAAAAAAAILLLGVTSSTLAQAPPQVTGYAPFNVTCPTDRSIVRRAGTVASSNQTVNQNEATYIQNHKQNAVAPAFQQFLANNLTGYDLNVLAPNASSWPTVGIAVSGGGFRAALYGAGTINALDGRNASSVERGSGGVFQLASYLTGLSGGAWFVGSMSINNMPSIQDLVLGGPNHQGWFLEYNLILPDGVISIFDNRNFYQNIGDRSDAKEAAGFNTSITDAWGIALAYHFGPGGTTADNFYQNGADLHNTNTQFGGIRVVSNFANYTMPFPAITANSRPPNYFPTELNTSTIYIPLNSTVYEFSPYEMGSFDPNLARFVELDYLGSNLVSGSPRDSNDCVNGFSNFGFLIGTSSSLFNAIVQTANSTILGLGDGSGLVEGAIDRVLGNLGADLRDSQDDVAIYPNSFQGVMPNSFPRSSYNELELVDGGENGANVPLDPLLVRAREVDTIIAVDGSADTDYNWPNATALRASYARAATLPDGYQILPYFPSAETFVNEGLNTRPTFFGCNASSTEVNNGMPMVIYMANAPSGSAYSTNTTTFTLEYSRDDTQSFLDSVWQAQSRGYPEAGQTIDPNYKACLGCAVVERKRQAAGLARSSVCETCFSRYCYDAGPADGGAMMSAFREVQDAIYTSDDLLHP